MLEKGKFPSLDTAMARLMVTASSIQACFQSILARRYLYAKAFRWTRRGEILSVGVLKLLNEEEKAT